MHSATAKANAAQVCPEGKELGSELVTSTAKFSMATQGRARLTRGLMVRLVTIRPKVMAVSAVPPARRVVRNSNKMTAKIMNSAPASPRPVNPLTRPSSAGTRRCSPIHRKTVSSMV